MLISQSKSLIDQMAIVNPEFFPLQVRNNSLQQSCLFKGLTPLTDQLLATCDSLLSLAPLRRALGAMVGMAVADSIGHNFEFLPIRDDAPLAALRLTGVYFEHPCAEVETDKFDVCVCVYLCICVCVYVCVVIPKHESGFIRIGALPCRFRAGAWSGS